MTASNSCFGRSHFTPLATIRLFLVALVATQYNVPWATGQLCAQLSGVNFTENFNTLSSTGSNNTSSSVPSEFAFVESPGNLTYAADNGSNATADTYSYGATGSSDRALGELTSAASVSTIGACFVNNTNHAFTSFLIGYAGEEWRLGVADATIDRLDFQYSTDASSLLSGTYINVDALDFTTPSNTGAGAKDGNAAANRTVFAPFAITFFSPLQPEHTFYIRWLATNISGANDGLAIDDFSIGTTLGPGVAGDYNNNGAVDAADYIIWRNRLNQATSIPNDITPGTVVAQDYLEWQQRFGKTSSDFASGTNVPEPGGCLYVMFITALPLLRNRVNRAATTGEVAPTFGRAVMSFLASTSRRAPLAPPRPPCLGLALNPLPPTPSINGPAKDLCGIWPRDVRPSCHAAFHVSTRSDTGTRRPV